MLANLSKLIVVILLIAILGCAAADVSYNQKDSDITLNPDKSLIIGDIALNIRGQWGINKRIVILEETATSNKMEFPFPNKGNYYIVLEPGTYNIHEIRVAGSLAGAMGAFLPANCVPTNLKFTVSPGEIVYLGRINLNYKLNFEVMPYGKKYWRTDEKIFITDEYSSAELEFRKKYPQINNPIVKRLLSN
jgi:hypothetical protein